MVQITPLGLALLLYIVARLFFMFGQSFERSHYIVVEEWEEKDAER